MELKGKRCCGGARGGEPNLGNWLINRNLIYDFHSGGEGGGKWGQKHYLLNLWNFLITVILQQQLHQSRGTRAIILLIKNSKSFRGKVSALMKCHLRRKLSIVSLVELIYGCSLTGNSIGVENAIIKASL